MPVNIMSELFFFEEAVDNLLISRDSYKDSLLFFTYPASIQSWSPYQTSDTLFKGNVVNLAFFMSPMLCYFYDLGEFVMLFAWSKKRF